MLWTSSGSSAGARAKGLLSVTGPSPRGAVIYVAWRSSSRARAQWHMRKVKCWDGILEQSIVSTLQGSAKLLVASASTNCPATVNRCQGK